jgi:hypothetical protein
MPTIPSGCPAHPAKIIRLPGRGEIPLVRLDTASPEKLRKYFEKAVKFGLGVKGTPTHPAVLKKKALDISVDFL